MPASLSRPFPFATLLPPLIGGGALVLGCQAAIPSATQAPTSPPAAVLSVEFDASDYSFNAPATLPTGLVSIRLVKGGHEPHHARFCD